MADPTRIARIYAAAARCGLLADVWVGARQVQVNLRQPDILAAGDTVAVEEMAMEYPTGLIALSTGDTVDVVQPAGGTKRYRVNVPPMAFGDGCEQRVMLLAE